MRATNHHGKLIQKYRESQLGISQEELGRRIGKSRRTIVKLEQQDFIEDIRLRRTLAWTLQIPPQCLDLSESTLIQVPTYYPLAETGRLGEANLGELETFLDNLRMRLDLYYLGSTLAADKNLDAHIQRLTQFAFTTSTSKEKNTVLSILSHNYQIKGMITRDQLQLAAAEKCFREASLLAQQGESTELNALAIGRLAGVHLIQCRLTQSNQNQSKAERQKQRHLNEALKLYEVAREISKHSPAVLRAYLAIGYAEVQGMLSDTNCLTSLSEARRLMSEVDHEDDELLLSHSTRCTERAIQDCWSQCHALIGKTTNAIEYYEKLEEKLDLNMTRMRARLSIQYAEALYASKDLSCCFYLSEGWKLACSTQSLYNIRRSEVLAFKIAQNHPHDMRVKDLLQTLQGSL